MIIIKNSKTLLMLLAILIPAAIFRFYGLTHADVITDENLVGFRAISYLDYLASPFQSTPLEWFDGKLPAWVYLSFHDHPPLFFIIHFLFFKIFGVSVFVLRLPEALAGIASVSLMYLLGKRLFSDKVGLAASALMAVTAYPIWVSRIALQESLVIMLSLLAIYFFLRALDNDKYFLAAGVALGLGLLTKYTVFILVLVFFLYLIIYKREVFKNKNFYFGAALTALLFSPVIIYNLKLYQAVGHFDLQFAYLFGQRMPEWQNLMGKPAGDYWDRAIQMVTNLRAGLTPTMFYSSILAAILFVWFWIKNKFKKEYTLIVLLLTSYFLLLLLIGPAPRFLALIIPWLLLLVAVVLVEIFKASRGVFRFLLIGILILLFGYEIFFSYNTTVAYYPVGEPGIDYAKPLKLDSFSWGFNQLNDYLEQLLKGKTPALSLPTKYQFLEKIKIEALARDEKEGKEKFSALIVYDANIYDLATMWLFWRRAIYEGWPIITADLFLEQGRAYFESAGFIDFYFIKATENVLLKDPAEKTSGAAVLVEKLKEEGIMPELLLANPKGDIVFEIYRF